MGPPYRSVRQVAEGLQFFARAGVETGFQGVLARDEQLSEHCQGCATTAFATRGSCENRLTDSVALHQALGGGAEVKS